MFEHVLDFWFRELTTQQWWAKDQALEAVITERFGHLHSKAAKGELFHWRHSAKGSLAEIILLDQFSRNMYRDTPKAFAFDTIALTLAQHAVDKGLDYELSQDECYFLYMPYMHSESTVIHEHALTLFAALGGPNGLEFEQKHKAIIDRFGRYPHRNDILGRPSTDEEKAFLQQPNSGF